MKKDLTPAILGLILSGGFSTRMGQDKSLMDYRGMSQYQYLCELLTSLDIPCWISCRKEQPIKDAYPKIYDRYADIGPLSGILSAIDRDPSKAWLVIACDMPLVTKEVVEELLINRDPGKQATFFVDPDSRLPEPFLSILEPSLIPVIQIAFSEKQYSLNAILQTCDGKALVPADSKVLWSVNTMEEYERVKNCIIKRH